MSEKGEKRASGRVFFEAIDNMRIGYIVDDLANRVIPADGWTPDVSALGVAHAGGGIAPLLHVDSIAHYQAATEAWFKGKGQTP